MIGFNIAIIGLLVLIFCALVALIRKDTNKTVVIPGSRLSEIISGLNAATQHYADVSAVVNMIRQLEGHPDALELLKSYPETVRAAAWLHYINSLGADLQSAQKYLSDCHQTYKSPNSPTIQTAQTHVDAIRAKLDAAVRASGQTGIHSV